MMHKNILSVLIILTVQTACTRQTNTTQKIVEKQETAFILPDGIIHVETIKKEDGALVIPYSKYTLANGLTVILHPDSSDPLVHVDVRYHVGSNREEVGKTGFGHLFEHMMFQGSENVKDEEHFAIISEAGGTANGEITDDWTNYHETLPANQLEKALWLEADRMGFLLSTMHQKKFELQREAVKNERSLNFDNAPYGQVTERVGEVMYPKGHPYSWHRIGYIPDLNAANLNDVSKFFYNYYGPNNSVLTIGGDFDEAKTLKWILKYFESIPAGPTIKELNFGPAVLEADRYISMEDDIELPLLYLSFPTVISYGKDEAPLDLLSLAIGRGKTSILYQKLVVPGYASQISAYHATRELAGEFIIEVFQNPQSDKTLQDIEMIVRDALRELTNSGITEKKISALRAELVSDKLFALETVRHKVDKLSLYQTYLDHPNGIDAEISRYQSVTKKDLLDVLDQYLVHGSAVIMRVVPKGKLNLVAPADTLNRPIRNVSYDNSKTDFSWVPPKDDFDRSVMPKESTNPVLPLPNYIEFNLKNTIPGYLIKNSETPTTTIEFVIKSGQIYEPLEKTGVAYLTAKLLEESTMLSSRQELDERLMEMGSKVTVDTGKFLTAVRIKSLSSNLNETIAIAAEKALQPKFDPTEFETVKRNAILKLRANLKDPDFVANIIFNNKVFGTDNTFSYRTTKTLANITLEDVKAFYNAQYSSSNTVILGVSDVPKQQFISALSPLLDWKDFKGSPPLRAKFPKINETVVYFFDRPSAEQSQIRIGKASMPYDHDGEFFKSNLVNYKFGEDFNSRLTLNLRENKGFTYSISSQFIGYPVGGMFRIKTGVKSDATAEAVLEIIKELNLIVENGISEEELEFTKNYKVKSRARKFESHNQKIKLLSNFPIYNLDGNYLNDQANVMRDFTQREANHLAAKHFNIDNMTIVIVGDKAKTLDDVRALGYPVIEIDEQGRSIKQ